MAHPAPQEEDTVQDTIAPEDVARACFAAYLAQDRPAMERLLAEEFVFTSPQDDHIDRAAFLEVCFPTADRVRSQEVLDAVPFDGGQVFVRYEYVLTTGERHRNVEVMTVRDGRLTETQVYFGGRFPQG
ncbi:nuclear transport factor 2 family protein [Streptomyces sp. NPDC057579]|uniref:nuclear transport factor 2 family protein n=1 Tax=Streptomyces sp. NPDC057579 TaxID=3346172 RepID=UPI0026A08470